MKPENPSSSHCKDVIQGVSIAAEKRLREAFGEVLQEEVDSDKTLSVHKLEKLVKLPPVKKMEKSLSLPDDTPEDARKFFND